MPGTVGSACREAGLKLARAGIEAASLEAQLLLASAIGKTREFILVHPEEKLGQEAAATFASMLDRRLSGEALGYITGQKEFFGHTFYITNAVLVPRPETELLVELALEYLRSADKGVCVHDACTGSGCVGISIAYAIPEAVVSVSDISAEALAVCKSNIASILGRSIQVIESDLLAGVNGSFHCITANPPYVTTAYTDDFLSTGISEPRLALDGGVDGLALYRRLVPQARAKLERGGMLLVEIGEEQGGAVGTMFTEAGFSAVKIHRDLAGHDRVVTGVLP